MFLDHFPNSSKTSSDSGKKRITKLGYLFQRFHNPARSSASPTAKLIKSCQGGKEYISSRLLVPTSSSLSLSLSLPVSETRDRKEEEKYAFSRLPGHEISRKFPRKVSPRSGIPPGQLNSRNRTRSLMQARARWNTEKGENLTPWLANVITYSTQGF